MNILLITDEYPPKGGGAGVVAKQFYSDCLNRGINVDIITISDLSGLNKKLLWLSIFISRIKNINIKKYDKVICNDLRAIAACGYALSREELKKTRVIIHGSENKIIYENPSILTKCLFLKKSFNRVLDNCDKIFFVSNFLRKEYIDNKVGCFYHNHIKEKIFVAYAGIENNWFNAKKKLLDNKSDTIKFVTVSRVVKSKGFLDILHSLVELKKSGKKLSWDIYGTGKDFDYIKNCVLKSELNSDVTFHGYTEKEHLYNKLSNYDIFTILPQAQESFGLVFVEAASVGIPSISFNKYGIVESIDNNKSGVLINSVQDFESAVEHIIKNYNDFSKGAVEYSCRFKSSLFVDRLCVEYD
ncbi:glycosyltransferase family 4 protein [Vibrio parahaemolyticus]